MTLRRSSLKRRKFPRMMPPKEGAPLRLPSHLAWTRGNRCEVESSGACSGKIEAHHVRENGNGGMGMKPGDDDVIALCAHHHRQLHHVGVRSFQTVHGCDLDKLAADNWKKSPHRYKAENR